MLAVSVYCTARDQLTVGHTSFRLANAAQLLDDLNYLRRWPLIGTMHIHPFWLRKLMD